ncbi:hypothetical protein FV228_30670, partial [Methylobacterium sp. WL18]|uniref:hypothetical protein n=1 Tax=Methylobacterium sp. WL18 TaxID=2603897 RepID=UPI0011D93691
MSSRPLGCAARDGLAGAMLAATSLVALSQAAAAQHAVVLDELSVESHGGTMRNSGPPPTGTIGQPPAAFAG